MVKMAQVERIRWLLHREGKSQRQVAKELGISRHTVAKYADRTDLPKYQRKLPRPASVLTPEVKAEIERLLAENDTLPRKQRWIGRTIFEALKAQGFQGSEPSVRRHIAQVRKERRKRAAFVPLEHNPGETAEFDWGEAEVIMAGQVIKAQILAYRLRWSGMPCVVAYPNQRQEAMFDGLRRAFETLGGVPLRLTSDNLTQAVQKILEGKNRKEQDAYRSFRTHYLVDSNFCNPASGHEKGSVENLVGFAQRNIVGPRLVVQSWEQLNTVLWERCLAYAQRVPRGESQSILERWKQEQRVLRPLPPHPFDCCKTLPVTSNNVACVSFDTCRYSVPVRYANHKLTLRAYWDRVEIYHGLQQVASHPRCYDREREILDLDHYLDLLLAKPGALSQAKPFRAADLHPVYHQFRAELCQRSRGGDREFIRILMLHREFPPALVQQALEQALEQRSICYDGVRQLLLCEPAVPRLLPPEHLDGLPDIRVRQPELACYDRLKGGQVH
jgi:transposase